MTKLTMEEIMKFVSHAAANNVSIPAEEMRIVLVQLREEALTLCKDADDNLKMVDRLLEELYNDQE